MEQETFACPECKALLRYSPNLKRGAQVQCPKCRTQFPVPDGPAPSAAPASRPNEEYTDSPGSPRPRFSEPAAEEISPTRRPVGYGRRPGDEPDDDYPPRPLSGEYSIDINRWFAFAGKHYSTILGAAIGFMFVAGILFIIPYAIITGVGQFVAIQLNRQDPITGLMVGKVLEILASLVLMPTVFFPLFSGFTAVSLAQLKGRPWTFGDFFSGFQRLGALAGVGLVSQLIDLAISLPQLVVMFIAMKSKNVDMIMMAPAFSLIGIVVVLFFQIRLLTFAQSLIFDRNLGAMDALKANWELTRGHFWGLFGVSFLLGLIVLGGALACLIGLLFAVPYTILILNAGYLLISDPRGLADRPDRYDD